MGYVLAAYIGIGLGAAGFILDIILNGTPKSMRRSIGQQDADEVDAATSDIRLQATRNPRAFAAVVLLLGATIVGWPALLPFFLKGRR
jgi:hypothetical protein